MVVAAGERVGRRAGVVGGPRDDISEVAAQRGPPPPALGVANLCQQRHVRKQKVDHLKPPLNREKGVIAIRKMTRVLFYTRLLFYLLSSEVKRRVAALVLKAYGGA